MTDPPLGARVRREHGLLSYLSTSRTILARVEEGVGEPGPNGVHAAMLDFRNVWQDLSLDPGGLAARQQVLGSAETLAQALRTQAGNVAREEADQRAHALNLVSDIDSASPGPAALNGDILVQGKEAGTFVLASGITPPGDADGSPLSYRIDTLSGSTALPAGAAGPGGELGAVTEVLTTRLPAYRAGLDAVSADVASALNAQQAAGYDATGSAGAPLFTYDPLVGAASLQVAISDPGLVAVSSLPGGALDGGNADLASRVGDYPEAYQRLVNGLGTQVSSLERHHLSTVENADLAETTVHLKLQEVAYQAALGATSRVLQPSLLDFLR